MIIPTETVYGMAAVFSNISAITRIFKVKERPLFNPLIVHIADRDVIGHLTRDVSPLAERLMERFWPGPLTLVLPKREIVPDLITAGLDTVAVRMPNHPIALELIRGCGSPLAAPSANLFGRLSATRLEDLDFNLYRNLDGAVDGGPCRIGVESTVVQVRDDEVELLRPGGISVESLRELIPQMKIAHAESEPAAPRRSPGRVLHHYAPVTPLYFENNLSETVGNRIGYLRFKTPPANLSTNETVEVLSPVGDLDEAAHNLFAALRRLDSQAFDAIVVERFPERELGIAINDRLERAAIR